jgi:hypothetical protein
MFMPKFIITFSIFLIIGLLSCSINNSDYVKKSLAICKDQPIPEDDWVLFEAIEPEDTLNILLVSYEMCGYKKDTLVCKAVFEHKKLRRYRCVAPWINSSEISLDNVHRLSIKKIPINSR